MPRRKSVKNIVQRLFGVLILLAAGSYTILTLEEQNAAEQRNWVLHTHEVIRETHIFLNQLTDAETGQRGFLLTQEQAYLEPYYSGLEKSNSSFKKLSILTSDNPAQQQRLVNIESLMQKKIAELDQTIRLVKQNRPEEALAIVKEDHGKIHMDSIRSILDNFISAEQQLLAQRESRFDEMHSNLAMLFSLLTFSLIAIILIIALIIRRRLVTPIIELTAEIKDLGQDIYDETDKDKSTSLDEMGRLSTAFDIMQGRIKKRSDELEEAKTQLEDQNEKLAYALQLAQEGTKAKSDFLARMSHEIRTPMNAIIGLSHLTLHTDLSPKQHDYLIKILSSGQSLLHLINDILDFSKIEAGKLELTSKEFLLDDVLNNVTNLIGIKASEKKLEIVFQVKSDVPLKLIGDQIRLEEILLNLTGNAVKFTEAGDVVVAVFTINTARNQIKLGFSIRDSGPGISRAQLDKLFKPFSQINENLTREHGGTGLGLVICKRLIEMMGGDIKVTSTMGQGSEFLFTAVFGSTGDSTLYHKALPTPYLHGLKVLAVDDNSAAGDALKHTLESLSFIVTLVSSGEEAVEVAQASVNDPYSLILIDQYMPNGMSGIDTFKLIHELPAYTNTPVVMLAPPYGGEEEFEKALQAGVKKFAYKPLGPSALFDAVMEAMGHKSTGQSASDNSLKQTPLIPPEKLNQIRGTSVLLVEDIPINQQVAVELLAQLGCVVEVADNGIEAIEKVQRQEFDIVFMDIQMPKMDGLEATRQIRGLASETGRNRFAQIPIVAMTAHALVGDHDKSIAAGMNAHLTKPLDPKKIVKTLFKWIEPKRGAELENNPEITHQPDTDNADVIPPLPGINTEAVLERMGGNTTLYIKLLKQFSQTNIDAATKIQDAFNQNKYEQANDLAHAVKGVAANLGMDELAAVSAQLMRLDSSTHESEQAKKLELFETHLNSALQAVEILDQHTAHNITRPSANVIPNAVDGEALYSLLNKLESSLDTDLAETAVHIKSLRDMLAHSEYAELLKGLEDQIDNFNSDGAKKTIHVIEQCAGIGGKS